METTRIINLSFQLWGSLLTIFIIMCLLGARRFRTKDEKLYLAMLSCNMLSILMDAAAFYFRGRMGGFAWFAVRGTNYFQFAFGNLLPLLFLFYLNEYIEGAVGVKVDKRYCRTGVIITAITEILLVGNLVFPYFYTINDQNIYSRLPLYPAMYVPMVVMLVVGLTLLRKYWGQLKRHAAIYFLFYSLIPAVSAVVSALVYGITFSYIGTTAALTVMFLYLQFEREQTVIVQSATKRVERLKDYEKLVNEGIKISLEAEDPDENISSMLQYVGKISDGTSAHIFETKQENVVDNTYEWCADKTRAQINNLQNIPLEVCAHWYEAFLRQEHICIRDTEEVKHTDPQVYEILKARNIKSQVVFPFWSNRQVVGFVTLENPNEDVFDVTRDVFEIIANFFVALFKKRDLIRELQHLSYTDAATGARNRFAMYQHFETLRDTKNVGVLFCDITGLKAINDTRGHGAGDELIRNTYGCLLEGFDASTIFRIGGDEFAVLSHEPTEEAFQNKVEIVRAAAEKGDIVVAIGSQWRLWVAETVSQTIKEAEVRMYAEKSEWYKKTQKEKRGR